ncbi:hypothetical protein CHS0354_030075 [Potamilus streckersoni]|uniref:magnesium chelatase n=1 Tax=Potamilus streckersoni TaxID=2493646 RepID=A0AAE0VDF1_9BIVA|nr:hypothetical protein CHS0354_030075 [Potamilus streckersoni]
MDEPFLVLATQNPLDQEGTYPLPEAQLDRFMMKVVVGYPSPEDEKLILDRYIDLQELPPVEPLLSAEEITEIKKYISQVYVDEKIRQYIVRLIHATRYPDEHGLSDLSAFIAVGASPRATLTLAAGSKAVAFMEGKGYVSPHEIKSIIRHILRHRIKLTFEASASGVNIEDIIERITLYRNAFRGNGIEFDQVREYSDGDESRLIDWNVTARLNHAYVKTFIEERNLNIVFLVDVSASMAFSSAGLSKRESAAEICAAIGMQALAEHDRTGLILFSREPEKTLPPGAGQHTLMRIVREVLFHNAAYAEIESDFPDTGIIELTTRKPDAV